MNSSIREMVGQQKVLSVVPETSVYEAATLMAKNRIGALPVMRETKLIGIFTERDLVSRVVVPHCDPERTSVDQVMTQNPITITADRTPCDALNLIAEHGFRHLPVMDGECLLAVLSLRDIPTKYRFMREKWLEMRQPVLQPSM